MNDIAIVGAGLVGTVLAIHLAKQNFNVTVYDRCPDPRKVKMGRSDRSLMIVLSARGLHALDAAGVGEAVRNVALPIYGRTIHAPDGELAFQPYGNNREALQAVDRNELNETLIMEAAKNDNITFHFEHECLDVDLSTPKLTFQDAEGSQREACHMRIIAADGAYSRVRQAMQKNRFFDFSQKYLPRSYKEIVIKPDASAGQSLSNETFHVWPRGTFMLSAFPKADGSFSLSLQLPREGENTFDTLTTESSLKAFFQTHFADVIPLAGDSLMDFLDRREGSMLTIKCFPWSHEDKVLLIGDAAHGILPFLGQGANAGFEDVMVLLEQIREHGDDWRTIFNNFEQARKPNTDTIANLSYQNYLILQDAVGDPNFQLRKLIERKIQDLYPDRISASLYYNIAFTRTPYQQAVQYDKAYQAVIDDIIKVQNIEKIIDTEQGEAVIRDAMNNHWNGDEVRSPAQD